MKIAFDLDDTLIIPAVATDFGVDTPSYSVISIYKWFQAQGCYMIIWSGSGKDRAKTWAKKLGLKANEYLEKTTNLKNEIDIAFDDSNIELAKVNVKVKRVNNKIIRYPEKLKR